MKSQTWDHVMGKLISYHIQTGVCGVDEATLLTEAKKMSASGSVCTCLEGVCVCCAGCTLADAWTGGDGDLDSAAHTGPAHTSHS